MYGSTVSPDGKLVAIVGPGQKLMLIAGFRNIVFTPDRKSYAYGLYRRFCTLYLVEGLK